MNYCFNSRPAFDVYTPKIFLDIKKRYDKDANGIFITTNKKETDMVRKTYPEALTYETSAYLKEHWNDFSFEMFCEYEKKYNCAPLWNYIYTDRFLVNRDYDYVVKITAGLFSFFEYVFIKHHVDIYYSECIATLQCYIAYLVGRKTGAKYYGQTVARGKSATHMHVIDKPQENLVGFNPNYQNDKYTEEEINEAKEYWENFKQHEEPPAYMAQSGKKPKFKLKFLLLPVYRFIKQFDNKLSDPYSYMYYEGYKYITNPLKFYIRYNYCKRFYHKAVFSRKYVYFPLHYQPEASTLVCALKYEKQLMFIDSWAKSLPADTLLYVKEHYAILGHRDISFYKELKKYPNVVLIDPWENSRKLIENAVAITTLTGTAGWEAMLFQKPVFLGGNVYFDVAPGVIKVNDIYGNYLPLLKNWKKPTDEEIIQYLCACFRAYHLGIDWYADSDDNISLIVDGLMGAIYENK